MSRKKVHETRVGRCAIRIYRDSEFNEYVVQTAVPTAGNAVRAEGSGYFTPDKHDARSTAAREVRRLRSNWWICGNTNRTRSELQRDLVRLDRDMERGTIAPAVGARVARELWDLIGMVKE